MAVDLNSEKLIAQYLLGELPEEQQIEIEDRAFEDEDYLTAITAVENDLIDEYVRHELSETERRKFESRFLASAERRKRVEFAKAFAKVAAESTVPKKIELTPRTVSWRESLEAFIRGLNPAARFAFAAIVLLILLGGAWLMTETLRLRTQLTQLQAENQSRQTERQSLQQQVETERRQNEELAARLNQEKQQREQSEDSLRQLSETAETTNPAPRPIIAALTLLPGMSRGAGEKPKLLLPENARLVRLQIGIDPEEPYQTFSAELRTVAGRQIWTRENLTARAHRGARAVGLTLPATALKPGQYELKLSGVAEGGRSEDIGFYYFDVIIRHD
ncbi:MAG TPA: hypothetical protein VJ875_14360 [Pyrinomonadaceae bacterium]|nr:hypothetical protein [Pyrinomonadaceae bacterium]